MKKSALSTETGFALSTTTILFYKKKIRRQKKYHGKNKNLVLPEGGYQRSNQVRFGLFSRSPWPHFNPMSVKPTGQSLFPSNVSFEIKSAQLALMALLLKSEHWDVIARDLTEKYGATGESPDFFDNDPVLLDFFSVAREAIWSDIDPLLSAMRACRLVPLAFRAEPGAWTQALLKTGLVQAPTEVSKANKPIAKTVTTASPVVREVPGPATMVIDKPVRSGQKIYARGADLVVLAMVNQGAEVVADGNIHVYAPLRGKAMAGARGNASARIFSLCLEPELISIAGVYRTSENPLPADVAGKPAQVRLSSDDGQDRLLIEPLKN